MATEIAVNATDPILVFYTAGGKVYKILVDEAGDISTEDITP